MCTYIHLYVCIYLVYLFWIFRSPTYTNSPPSHNSFNKLLLVVNSTAIYNLLKDKIYLYMWYIWKKSAKKRNYEQKKTIHCQPVIEYKPAVNILNTILVC